MIRCTIRFFFFAYHTDDDVHICPASLTPWPLSPPFLPSPQLFEDHAIRDDNRWKCNGEHGLNSAKQRYRLGQSTPD